MNISAEDVAGVYVHMYIHRYTYSLETWSTEMVIFGRCMLQQYQSFHFDLLDSYGRFVIVNECAHIVKDSNV